MANSAAPFQIAEIEREEFIYTVAPITKDEAIILAPAAQGSRRTLSFASLADERDIEETVTGLRDLLAKWQPTSEDSADDQLAAEVELDRLLRQAAQAVDPDRWSRQTFEGSFVRNRHATGDELVKMASNLPLRTTAAQLPAFAKRAVEAVSCVVDARNQGGGGVEGLRKATEEIVAAAGGKIRADLSDNLRALERIARKMENQSYVAKCPACWARGEYDSHPEAREDCGVFACRACDAVIEVSKEQPFFEHRIDVDITWPIWRELWKEKQDQRLAVLHSLEDERRATLQGTQEENERLQDEFLREMRGISRRIKELEAEKEREVRAHNLLEEWHQENGMLEEQALRDLENRFDRIRVESEARLAAIQERVRLVEEGSLAWATSEADVDQKRWFMKAFDIHEHRFRDRMQDFPNQHWRLADTLRNLVTNEDPIMSMSVESLWPGGVEPDPVPIERREKFSRI